MRKTIALTLCLLLVFATGSAFAATQAQQTPATASANSSTLTTTTIVPVIELPAYMPVISGYVDIQGMPTGVLSAYSYVPSQPNGALVQNWLNRQYGLMLNFNLDGNVTSNTAYHLNGNGYVNYSEPLLADTNTTFSPVLEGSGYVYNIAPYLGFINYQAGRMAYSPGAGLLLFSNMDGAVMNLDFGQLQVNLYAGNDITPAMQAQMLPLGTEQGLSAAMPWLLQASDSNPYNNLSRWPVVAPGESIPQNAVGARMAAADISYNFNNPWTVKYGYSTLYAADIGNGVWNGTRNGGTVATKIDMMDLGVFYDDGTFSGWLRGGYSPTNNDVRYKTMLNDSLCMAGGDLKVQYGRYDVSSPGTYDAAFRYSKVGPLAGFAPDVPLIANSGEAYRVYGDYVIDTNFKGNLGYTYIMGLQPTAQDQVASENYDNSSIINLGLTYYF